MVLLNSASWQIGFDGTIAGAVDGQLVFVAGFHALALLTVASVVRRPGAATLTALIYSLLYAGGWLFADWATPAYAAALGLFPRDNAVGIPQIVAVLPRFVLVAAAAIDLGLVVARRRGVPVGAGVLLSAAIGMAVLGGLDGGLMRSDAANPLADAGIVPPLSGGMVAATAAAAAVVGAFGGWAGWNLGVVLRGLAGAGATNAPTEPRAAPRPRSGAARWRTTVLVGLLGSLGALALPAGGDAAQGAVDGAAPGGDAVAIVHREVVAAGPYRIDVGFTEWPLRAERSLDILFEPEGGSPTSGAR